MNSIKPKLIQIDITLIDIKPKVQRKIVVPENISLADLHYII